MSSQHPREKNERADTIGEKVSIMATSKVTLYDSHAVESTIPSKITRPARYICVR